MPQARKKNKVEVSNFLPSDREPPKSIEAERAVLGAILLEPKTIYDVLNVFGVSRGSDLFYYQPHQMIYDAIFDIYMQKSSIPPDFSSVSGYLESKNLLSDVGGISYLAELRSGVVSLANVVYYANIVLETALLRKLIQRCNYIVNKAYEGDVEVKDLLNEAEKEIFAIATQRKIQNIESIGVIAEHLVNVLSQRVQSKDHISGLPTGYPDLDECLSGLQKADMIVIAARPSVGKTAFALNLAKNVAIERGRGVLIFSLEMSKQQIVNRLVSLVGMIDGHILKKNLLMRKYLPDIVKIIGELKDAPIYIDDTPGINVLELRSKARRHIAENPNVELIIIDYLQLMSSAYRGENRQVEIAEISRHIKELARELDLPVVTLCQLSREAEKSGKEGAGEPKLSHLRESGAIEQDADVVMMLYLDPVEDARKNKKGGMESSVEKNVRVNLKIAKHRNGPLGHFLFNFNRETQLFTLYEKGVQFEEDAIAPRSGAYVDRSEIS